MKSITKICLSCMECCKHLGFVITASGTDTVEELVQMYKWRGCEVKEIKGNKIFIITKLSCHHLTNFGCAIYHKRPAWCRRYDGKLDPAMNDKCKLLERNKEESKDDV